MQLLEFKALTNINFIMLNAKTSYMQFKYTSFIIASL